MLQPNVTGKQLLCVPTLGQTNQLWVHVSATDDTKSENLEFMMCCCKQILVTVHEDCCHLQSIPATNHCIPSPRVCQALTKLVPFGFTVINYYYFRP